MKCELAEIEWSSELASGLADIDRQHQHLLDLLKQMLSQQELTVDSEAFVSLLNEFQQAVTRHFDFEEALLEKLGYPDLEEHRHMHEGVLLDLAEVDMTAMFKNDNAPLEFVKALCDWFETHLQDEDKQYFSLLRESIIPSR